VSRSERGVGLAEAVVVTGLVALIVSAAGVGALNWLRAEKQRSAAYQTYGQMTLARVEATKRNRSCRFTLDTATRRLRVLDLNDPGTSSDDQEISSTALDSSVTFGRPDTGAAITLPLQSGTTYFVTYRADGTLESAGGTIGLSNPVFRRVTASAGGVVMLERWTGSVWVAGS